MHNQKIKTLLVLLIAFIAATYIPLLINGGIIVDDWGDISHNLNCLNFIDCYGSWFPLFSNRPLAPLPITALTFIFENNYAGYLISNSLIYFLSIALCAKIVNEISNFSTGIIFTALASIPIIAMPLIASPINQSTATVSFLFWSLSLYCLVKFTRTGNIHSYTASYLWLFSAFLTYEVILPLLALSILLPFVVNPDLLIRKPLRYLLKFALPIVIILFLVIVWQKGIAPQFMEVDSRLKFQVSHIVPKIYTWIHVFYGQIPQLFWKTYRYLDLYNLLTALLVVALLWIGQSNGTQNEGRSRGLRFALVSALSFFASCSIFILSDESAVSSGYQARGLSSTWFTFALLFGSVFSLLNKRNSFFIIFLIGVGFFSSLSFSTQRDQYIKSWDLQTRIISDVSRLVQVNNVSKPAIIIGNVPKYLDDNYNDEIVFSQPWDFGAALALNTNNVVIDGFPIDARKNDLRLLSVTSHYVSAQNWTGSNFENLWFYDFDPTSRKGELKKVVNGEQLLRAIELTKTNSNQR